MENPLPHRNLLTEGLVVIVNECGECHQNYGTDYLPEFSHVVALVGSESFDGHSLIIVFALPNIAKSSRCDGIFSGLDAPIGNDVGGWELPCPTAQLAELFEYPHIMVRDRKDLHDTAMLRNTLRNCTYGLKIPYQTLPTVPSTLFHLLQGRRGAFCTLHVP